MYKWMHINTTIPYQMHPIIVFLHCDNKLSELKVLRPHPELPVSVFLFFLFFFYKLSIEISMACLYRDKIPVEAWYSNMTIFKAYIKSFTFYIAQWYSSVATVCVDVGHCDIVYINELACIILVSCWWA